MTAPSDFPGGASGEELLQGAFPGSIDRAGVTTRVYSDARGVLHGLVLTPSTLPRTATPTFSGPSGTLSSAQAATISDATAGATIFYATNGTTPAISSTPYIEMLEESTTVK